MFVETAEILAQQRNITPEQRMAVAELRGNDVRDSKRWTFWPVAFFAGVPIAALVSLNGIAKEAEWNKVTSQAADEIHAQNPQDSFANEVRKERAARRTSRVLAGGLLTVGAIGAKVVIGAAVVGATLTLTPAVIGVGAALGVAELGWVAAKTIENHANGRATRHARRALAR